MGRMGVRGSMIPATTQIRPRPIYHRFSLRFMGLEPGPPTEEEKADALRILEQFGYPDDLYVEAERLLREWGERGGADVRLYA